jgi:hypothetical protein
MENKQIGHFYKLYCWGWRNGSTNNFPRLLHRLLSTFLYYRRGFAAGTECWQDRTISAFINRRKKF